MKNATYPICEDCQHRVEGFCEALGMEMPAVAPACPEIKKKEDLWTAKEEKKEKGPF